MPAPNLQNRVAVVTGAGAGLGKAYALLFASLGAKVVINDIGVNLGGETDSTGGKRPAEKVVEEIKALGGDAVPNFDSVESGHKIIQTAIDTYGRIDILVNNAGILRDVSFSKMTEVDWDKVLAVHLKGAFLCTKAAWPYMIDQKYGRILNIISAAGLYGNFGQANYSTAKSSLLGFTKTLALEGGKKNVFTNCIAPLAGTRMIETVLPKEMADILKPEYVAPIVAYLCSEECQDNGQVFELGAGWVAKIRQERSAGHYFASKFTVDDVSKIWPKLNDFSKSDKPTSVQESMQLVLQHATNKPVSQSVMAPQSSAPKTAAAKPAATKPKNAPRARKIYSLMKAYIERFPDKGKELVQKVKCAFLFEITSEPPFFFTIDLKSGSGSVKDEKNPTVDATMTMDEDTFVGITLGTLNPNMAFLKGKLKLKGRVQAAMKFSKDLFPPISMTVLKKDTETAVADYFKDLEASASPSSTGDKLLNNLIQSIGASRKPVNRASAYVYQWNLDIPGEKNSTIFTVDLKSSSPKAALGKLGSPDVTLKAKHSVFSDIVNGKLTIQNAINQGKVEVVGGNRTAAFGFALGLYGQSKL